MSFPVVFFTILGFVASQLNAREECDSSSMLQIMNYREELYSKLKKQLEDASMENSNLKKELADVQAVIGSVDTYGGVASVAQTGEGSNEKQASSGKEKKNKSLRRKTVFEHSFGGEMEVEYFSDAELAANKNLAKYGASPKVFVNEEEVPSDLFAPAVHCISQDLSANLLSIEGCETKIQIFSDRNCNNGVLVQPALIVGKCDCSINSLKYTIPNFSHPMSYRIVRCTGDRGMWRGDNSLTSYEPDNLLKAIPDDDPLIHSGQSLLPDEIVPPMPPVANTLGTNEMIGEASRDSQDSLRASVFWIKREPSVG